MFKPISAFCLLAAILAFAPPSEAATGKPAPVAATAKGKGLASEPETTPVAPGAHFALFCNIPESGLPNRRTIDKQHPFMHGSIPRPGLPPASPGLDKRSAIRWNGLLKIPAQGEWTFHTVSNGGSLLCINRHLVVESIKSQSTTERSGSISLSPGLVPFNLYAQGGW